MKLDIKKVIETLLADLEGLPVEERNRQLEALRAEIDAVINPVASEEETKTKVPSALEEDEETDEQKRARLFGE